MTPPKSTSAPTGLRLEGPQADAYVRVLRSLLAVARAGSHYPDPGRLDALLGLLGPAGSCGLHPDVLVDPVEVWIPFILDGVVGDPGVGRFTIDIPIPVNISLLGFNLNAQAGIVDFGATFGVSMTNAVEAWIL